MQIFIVALVGAVISVIVKWFVDNFERVKENRTALRGARQLAEEAVVAADNLTIMLQNLIVYYEDPESGAFPYKKSDYDAALHQATSRIERLETEFDRRNSDLKLEQVAKRDRYRQHSAILFELRILYLARLSDVFWDQTWGIFRATGWIYRSEIEENDWSSKVEYDIQKCREFMEYYDQTAKPVLKYLQTSVRPYAVGKPMRRSFDVLRRPPR